VDNTARALIGRTLGGRFKLTSYIGEGAMAAVFRGEQTGEPRQVAVKVMHRGLSSDQAFVKRFQREAQAAARIDHRNTVRILEHGCDRDVVYIAMELVSGQDLYDVLVRERRLSEARAGRIVLQVCAALDAAHRHGVVHRDLKPENVMLVSDPDDPEADLVKVLDFGIAKLVEEDRNPLTALGGRADSIITLVGTVIGTPEYMSPEQARGIPMVDARSDVYACGVLLYQLVTGRLPFTGDSPIDVILQHVEREPVPPSAMVPSIHPGLERIILTALAKWPAERQQSARMLAEQIAAILPELTTSRRPSGLNGHGPDSSDPSPTLKMVAPSEARPPPHAWTKPSARRDEVYPPPLPARLPLREAPSPWAMPVAPARRADLAAPGELDEDWIAPWWVFVIAVALLCAAIWLSRSPE
jgi:eukaryotic-like serine/threonine-protein kinase